MACDKGDEGDKEDKEEDEDEDYRVMKCFQVIKERR